MYRFDTAHTFLYVFEMGNFVLKIKRNLFLAKSPYQKPDGGRRFNIYYTYIIYIIYIVLILCECTCVMAWENQGLPNYGFTFSPPNNRFSKQYSNHYRPNIFNHFEWAHSLVLDNSFNNKIVYGICGWYERHADK